jgi:tetratricopeptide (TPR) repeat protein
MAHASHQLGMVAQHSGRLEEAGGWYKRALAIFEAMGDQPYIGTSYHQLGVVAALCGRLEEAEGWFKRSLAIKEVLANQPTVARTLANLGKLKGAAGDLKSALFYAIRACAPFDEFPNLHSSAPLDLANHWRSLGRETVTEAWQEVTGRTLPADVAAALDELADQIARQNPAADAEPPT